MSSEIISEIIKYPNGSTIYLSGTQVYTDVEKYLVRDKNISVVLSFINEPITTNLGKYNIQNHIFYISDEPNQNIYQHFENSYRIILRAIRENRNILIHCRAGISRSPTIVVAFFLSCIRCNPELVIPYIPRSQKTWTDSILTFISKKRYINPNFGFHTQLLQYEQVILPKLNCNRIN
jgi:protein tyrosine phosphatase